MRKNLYKVIYRVDNGVDIEYYRSFVLAENLSAAEGMINQYWTKQYDTSIEIKSSQEIDVFEEKIVGHEMISWYAYTEKE